MEIKRVYVKTRAEFGKQCIFDMCGPNMDVNISPHPAAMNDYIRRTHCHVGVQHSKQLALHEAQTFTKSTKNSGMFHFEGGWPKEINPRDEETTTRFRRRIEKDDHWAPKLRNLFEVMEHNVLQNGTMDIYQHYFDDMIPTPLVQPLGFRTVNVYSDPETPKRPVTNISWSPDSGSRIAVCYCFLDYGRLPDYSKRVYIWQVDNPNEPYMALEPSCPCVACEFNPRDPSVLASGLMTGQVCNWDVRTGNTPVQISHLQWSHREFANAVKWIPTKSNTEFFSTSSDGRAMWWDTRQLRGPIEVLMFDLEFPNDPHMDRAVGVSCLDFGPMIGTKFTFGLENGIVVTGSRKVKTNAEKLAVRFAAHYGQVYSVDRNISNPALFLTVGDWRARVWAEDTREGNLVSTLYLRDYPTAGCWNKARYSVFYVTTGTGRLLVWDILQTLRKPVFTMKLCDERLTALAPCEEGVFLAIGNCVGNVYLVEPTDFFGTFDRKDRNLLSEYLERCSKLTKAVDVRLREIRLMQKITEEEEAEAAKSRERSKAVRKTGPKSKDKARSSRSSKEKAQVKEKKKLRMEEPELTVAETKYFEAVQKGLEAYESETDADVIPVFQTQTGAKKADKKRKPSRSKDKDDESKKGATKASGKEFKMKKSIRSIRKQKSSAELSEELADRFAEQSIIALPSAALDEDTKKTKKKPKPKITFTLPVPCKGEVCKPKVCCWRKTGRKVRRKEKASVEKDRKSAEISAVSLVRSMSAAKYRKQSHVLREMRAPPTELSKEVVRAKQEIRIARLLKEKLRKKSLSQLSVKKREAIRRKKRATYRLKVETSPYEEDEEDDKALIPKEDEKERKRKVAPYPCSPPKGKSVIEMATQILGVSLPELTKKKAIGRRHLEAHEHALRRVYPRISEFGHYE